MSDPSTPSAPGGAPAPTPSPAARVQEQLDAVAARLDGLVAALDADGSGLAGRLLAHQEEWERQAEARVSANTRRVDELMVALENTGGTLAALERAVSTLGSQLERQAPSGVEEQIDALRDELLMKQAAFAGALREAVDEAARKETERRTAEEAEFRREQARAQQVMASAVLDALEATAADDVARLDRLRAEVTDVVATVRAGLVTDVAATTATETEQVRTVLNSAVQRMVEVQNAAVHDELHQMVTSFEQRLNQLSEAFQLEAAVVAGLRAEIRDTAERSGEATIAVVREEILELRNGLQAVEEVSTRTADWLRADRSEGAAELRSAIVGVAQVNFDKVSEMVSTSLEASVDKSAEVVKAELATFQRELEASRAATTGDVDRVAKLVEAAVEQATAHITDAVRTELTTEVAKLVQVADAGRAAADEKVDGAVEVLTSEVGSIRTSLDRAVADAAASEAATLAELRADLRAVIERTTGDIISAVRSDVAGVRAALGATELSAASAADGVSAMRVEVKETLREALRGDLEGLVSQLGFGIAATIERADDRSVESVREELATLRLQLDEALRNEARGRNEALAKVRDDVTEVLNGLGEVVGESVATSGKATADQVDELRLETEAALIALRTTLAESLAKDSSKELAARLGNEIGTTLGSLERALAEALEGESNSREQQQRVLRDELADALAAVAQLVVDTARGEAEARSIAFDTTAQRIDQLARAISAVVTAQTDLRAAFLQRFGQ